MSLRAAIKLFATAKKVHDYVVEKNTLDHQMEMVLSRLERLESKCKCKPKKTKEK